MPGHIKNRTARCIAALCAIIATALPLNTALAQNYPDKAVRLISAHAAGGAADTLSRIIADRLSSSLGQQFIVENRPGASTMMAAELVARAPADGHTLLMATVTTLSINPALVTGIKYDSIKDFAPITVVASTPFFLGTNINLPVASITDLVQMGRQKPGVLNYGSSGNGTSSHLAGELFNLMAGIRTVHIPYKATSTRNTDLSSGVIQMVFGNDLLPFSRAGKVRILGVTSAQRLSGYPDIPTVAEAGNLPGYEASVWYGLVAPAGTPPVIINRLNDAIRKILAEPLVKDKIMNTLGGDVVGNSPQQFANLIKSDIEKWSDVVKRSKISGVVE